PSPSDELAVPLVPFTTSGQIRVVDLHGPGLLWRFVFFFSQRESHTTLLNHSLWSIGILGGCACGAASVGSPPNCRRVPRNRSAAPEKTLCVRRAPEASLPPERGAWGCDFPVIGDPTDDPSATGLGAAALPSPSLGVT